MCCNEISRWVDISLASKDQQNSVSNVMGEPGGPTCQPCSTTSINISTTSRMSNLPGCMKLGSASWMSNRWFHFKSKGMGWSGRSHVTRGTTMAVTANFLLGSHTYTRDSEVSDWLKGRFLQQASNTWNDCTLMRVRQRLCVRRSEIIEAEEAQSRMTRASPLNHPEHPPTHDTSWARKFSPVAAWDGMDSAAEMCVNQWCCNGNL